MSVKLSKKHGVNPSIVVCPICKKDVAVALLGRLKGDVEAPKTIEGDLCEDCAKQYLTIIEVESKEHPVRTGRRVFVPRDALAKPIDGNFAKMVEEEFNELFGNNNNEIN